MRQPIDQQRIQADLVNAPAQHVIQSRLCDAEPLGRLAPRAIWKLTQAILAVRDLHDGLNDHDIGFDINSQHPFFYSQCAITALYNQPVNRDR
jgi:hypothetical protein